MDSCLQFQEDSNALKYVLFEYRMKKLLIVEVCSMRVPITNQEYFTYEVSQGSNLDCDRS